MRDFAPGVQRAVNMADAETYRVHNRREIQVVQDGAGFKAAHPSYPEVVGRGREAQDAIDDWYIQVGTTWHPQRIDYVFSGMKTACELWLKMATNSERAEVVANIMEIEAFERAFRNGALK